MSDLALVGCALSDAIGQEEKYRISVEQSDIERLVWGDSLTSVYQKMSIVPWGYVVSEPPPASGNGPFDAASIGSDAMVVDIRISHSTVGSAPPGTVSDLYQAIADLLLFSSARYAVTRIEKLSTTQAIDGPAVVLANAKADAKGKGASGVLAGVGQTVSHVFSGLKTVLVVTAVIVGAIAVIYVAKEAKAARAA